jgi:hypothetical protein
LVGDAGVCDINDKTVPIVNNNERTTLFLCSIIVDLIGL